jgi:uncharacterized protein (DUF924 family)
VAKNKQVEWRYRHDGEPTSFEQDAELAALMQLLARSANVQPSPQFQRNARRQLLEKLPARASPEPTWLAYLRDLWQQGQIPQRTALAWMLLLLFLFTALFATGGAVYASADALPGQALYPVKLGVEDWRLWLTEDSLARGQMHLTFADRRLGEMEQLQATGNAAGIQTAADRYIQHTNQAQAHLAPALANAGVMALTDTSQQTFTHNELALVSLIRQASPESWGSLNRAYATTANAREAAQVVLLTAAADDQERARLQLQFANERLTLAVALADLGRTADLNQVLADYSQRVELASSLIWQTDVADGLLADWGVLLSHHDLVLAEVAQRAPIAASAAIAHAREVSQTGRQVVEAIRAGEEIPGPPVQTGPPVDPPVGPPVDPPVGPPVDPPAGPPVDPPVGPPTDPPGAGPPPWSGGPGGPNPGGGQPPWSGGPGGPPRP